MKYILIFLCFFSLTSCIEKKSPNKIIERKKVIVEKELVDIINDTLSKKIKLNTFIDSITEQKNVIIIDELKEVINQKENYQTYKGNKYEFKFVTERNKDNEINNSIFIDGKNKFSFNNYKVLVFNDEKFESEDFGFNYQNLGLESPKVIEIANKKFLYSGIAFSCNGIGCGCQLNLIYDIEQKKLFFIDNYRFPFYKYFISDFNNDKVVDLIIVSRGKERNLKGTDVEQNTFRITWFEYKKNKFIERINNSKENSYFEFISYTKSFNHGEAESCNYSILKENWK